MEAAAAVGLKGAVDAFSELARQGTSATQGPGIDLDCRTLVD